MSGYHLMIPLTCVGRSSEDLLGATMGSCSWKMQVRISGVATMTMGAVFSGLLCCSVKMSLVLCQDLAGSWYAQRERGAKGEGSVSSMAC